MKLLVLTAAYPAPSEPERAVYVENITRALGEAGEREEPLVATVVAPRVAPQDPLRETRHGIEIRRFRYPGRGRRLKDLRRPSSFVVGAYLVSAAIAAHSEACRTRPDLILGHWVLPTGPVGALLAKTRRLPLLLVAHGSDIHRYALSSRVSRRLAAGSLRVARLAIAVSREIERILVESLSVPPEKVRRLPMGIDERLFGSMPPSPAEKAELRQRLRLDPGATTLLFVGDLIEEKGVPELLRAHEALARNAVGGGRPVDLIFIGGGRLRPEIASRAAAGARIRVAGRVPQEDLPDWYRAADLLVLPSRGEGSPIVVMEALACGLPVVATAVGGIPDLVEEGVTGRLAAPRDEGGLLGALREAIRDESLDRFRRSLGGKALDFGVRRRARELRRILQDLVEPRGGGSHA